jgi:tyrosine-protein kinase Etk/Wzc
MDRTIELGRLWDRVHARRRAILWLVIVSTVIVGAVAFLLPSWYRAEASLLPPGDEASFGLGNLLKGIGVPGVKVPTQATPADVFLAILESRRASEEMVQRFDLKRRYHKRFMVDAVKELRRHVSLRVDDVGIIRISVEDRDPRRAAQMANTYFEVLDRFNREIRMTKGRRTRIFVGGRLEDTRQAMTIAEQRLTEYESKHKAVALSPEASTAMEAAARLYATRAALQVRLGVIRSYTRERTDEERQIGLQLGQIDRQLSALPGTGMDLARLVRDAKMQAELFFLLTAQFEDARIQEARDVSTVEQLDVATPPEKKSRPRRALMMAVAFVFSLAAGVTYALIRSEDAGRGGIGIPTAG